MTPAEAVQLLQASGYAYSTAQKYVREFMSLEADPQVHANPDWTPTTTYQYMTAWRTCTDVLGPDAHASLRSATQPSVSPIRLPEAHNTLLALFLADLAPAYAATSRTQIVRALTGTADGQVNGTLLRRFAHWCRQRTDVPYDWIVPINQWLVEPVLHYALAHLTEQFSAARLVAMPADALDLEARRLYVRADHNVFYTLEIADIDAFSVLRRWANHGSPDHPLVPIAPYSSQPMSLHGLHDLVRSFGPSVQYGSQTARRRPVDEATVTARAARAAAKAQKVKAAEVKPKQVIVSGTPPSPGTPPPIGLNAPIVDPYKQDPE